MLFLQNPVWISDGDDDVEILVVEIHVNGCPIRMINGYGPQECNSVERKSLFWSRLQSEVSDALEADVGIYNCYKNFKMSLLGRFLDFPHQYQKQ